MSDAFLGRIGTAFDAIFQQRVVPRIADDEADDNGTACAFATDQQPSQHAGDNRREKQIHHTQVQQQQQQEITASAPTATSKQRKTRKEKGKGKRRDRQQKKTKRREKKRDKAHQEREAAEVYEARRASGISALSSSDAAVPSSSHDGLQSDAVDASAEAVAGRPTGASAGQRLKDKNRQLRSETTHASARHASSQRRAGVRQSTDEELVAKKHKAGVVIATKPAVEVRDLFASDRPIFELLESCATYILISQRPKHTLTPEVSSNGRINLTELWRRATKASFLKRQRTNLVGAPFLSRNLRRSAAYVRGEGGIAERCNGVVMRPSDPDQVALHPTLSVLVRDNEKLHQQWEEEYTRAERVLGRGGVVPYGAADEGSRVSKKSRKNTNKQNRRRTTRECVE